MIAIASSKDRRTNGKGHCTVRNRPGCATREFRLRINCGLKLSKYAIQKVFNACTEVGGAEGFYGFFKGSKTPVVSDVSIVAPETESVPSMERAEILVNLDKVLRAPEGDRVARCKGGISRHADEVALDFGRRNRVHVQGRPNWIGTQGLEEIQAVENNLRLAGQFGAKGVNHGE